MADSRNFVRIEGYLKENTLALGRSKNTHEEILSGSVTIMVSENEEYRLFYYTNRYKKLRPGETEREENRIYKDLVKLLPDKTTSFAKVLEVNKGATFESVKNSLTKVTATAKFEERFFKDRTDAVRAQNDVRGISLFADSKEFNPRSYFELDGFVTAVRNEKDKEGEETGRVIVEMGIVAFDGRTHKISFVSASPEVAAALNDFAVNETYTIRGHLSRLRKTTTVQAVPTTGSFGEEARPQTVTEFIDERVITGGNTTPLQGEKAISLEDIKKGLVLRSEEMQRVEASDNSKKSTLTVSAPTAKASGDFGAPAAPSVAGKYDDIDF